MRLLCVLLLVSALQLQCHGLLLPLTNTLSSLRQTNDTPVHHLLRSSSLRSAARHHRHRAHRSLPPRGHRQLSLPLSPGSDYTLSLSVGPQSAAAPVSLFLDTGSDLVWFPCAPFTCMLCEGKPTPRHSSPLPPPIDSRRVSCASPLCSAAHSSAPPADLCAAAQCPLEDIETDSCGASHACPPLYYAYGDGSLIAHLRRGRVGLAASMAVENFTFACAHTTLGEPVGVAGFGRGPLSLPAQLSPTLSGRFSYCLVAHSFRADRLIRPSPLILGRSPDTARLGTAEPDFVYTPLLHNPKHPYFYSVALEAVSVGGTRIQARPELGYVDRAGNGGMVVDSGTTFTMLPNETYARVAEAFGRAMAAARFVRAERSEAQTGLTPCYYYAASDRAANRGVPPLALHFRGNATVALPRRNYFMGFKSEGRDVGCLMLMNGGDASGEGDGGGGPAGTLGNFQQQGFEVMYDVDAGRVGFARRRCTDLWDSLSRR
ncbi:probable aspartyl protease At4g16563 [Phragmites australis]|uniref:probable aspartyl protease At4g16563 n=1 Tax=Phragmites australis TaxID=29695 RepID=UPI002D795438|nr:probable aspartyl protease At4g16563 [Phragmites australis]